ncbi:MAG TPA: 3-phosphoshikimate 1-carboxyvinyltransferase, partial [bacterium]|nr:3-phosphoshikimate 1-carboxyvinyltransferase [bacterium]
MNHTTIPHQRLRGEIVVAPDKSISHRSLILGAIAQGESHIKNLLLGEDVLRTLTIINQLGIKTSHDATTITQGDELTIFGNGLSGLQKPNDDLYCGNSGTTMRLMLGLLSGQSFSATLTGDESLDQRPMDRVLEPLRQMGAAFEVEHRDGKRFIKTLPRPDAVVPFLKGLEYVMPVASAQVKTGIALAGLYAAGEVIIKEPFPSRNHTELMMKSMRVRIKAKDREVCLNQVGKLKPLNLIIPGDLSSAAF